MITTAAFYARIYTYKPVRFFLVTNVIMWARLAGSRVSELSARRRTGQVISALEILGLWHPHGL